MYGRLDPRRRIFAERCKSPCAITSAPVRTRLPKARATMASPSAKDKDAVKADPADRRVIEAPSQSALTITTTMPPIRTRFLTRLLCRPSAVQRDRSDAARW